MTSAEKYLDPKDYNSSPFYYGVLFFLRRYSDEVIILLSSGVVFTFDILTGVSATGGGITDSMIVLFLLAQGIIPFNLARRAKEVTSHGGSLPETFEEIRHWLKELAAPLTVPVGVTVALVIYSWSAASNSFIVVAGLTPVLALVTELCLIVWASALGWRSVMNRIKAEKYNSVSSGLTVFLPISIIFAVTSIINIQSGVVHWQDSIVAYLPGALISIYISVSTSGPNIDTPDRVVKKLATLNELRLAQVRRVEWLQARLKTEKKAKKAKKDYDYEREKLSELDRTIYRLSAVMQTYSKLVSDVIESIKRYQKRRLRRDSLLSETTKPGHRLDSATEELLTKGMDWVQPPPPNDPGPFLKTRTFEFMRKSTTILFFTSILVWKGLYARPVPTPGMQAKTLRFDETMFSRFAPASFEYFTYRHEVPEVSWLWNRVQTVESAQHCVEFLSNLVKVVDEYNTMMTYRDSGMTAMAKMQPESGELQSVERYKETPMAKFASGIAPARLQRAREAWQMIQPVVQTLNALSEKEGGGLHFMDGQSGE
ncbi:MAG: hypothetical protein ABSB56_02975 [Nitrososphaerales archaeon]|jgi:hypothetical protein